MKKVFWSSAAWLLAVIAGYPAILLAASKFFKPNLQTITSGRSTINSDRSGLPRLSLIIPAYNEELCISGKIRNCLEIDYDRDRLQIIIVSDGSTDNTEKFSQHPAVKLLVHKERKGKISAINTGALNADGDILVFTDANCMLHPQALRRLIKPFSDPCCGFACGDLRLYTREYSSLSSGELKYWAMERFLRSLEDQLGTVVGVAGSLFAVRRSLYPYPPPDTILDDLDIALQIAGAGHSLRWVHNAIAYEETAQSSMCEISRKTRLIAGGYQTLFRHYRYLNPRYGWLAAAFLFHKVLRWIAPIISAIMLMSLYILRKNGVYRFIWNVLAALQTATLVEGVVRITHQKITGTNNIKIQWTGPVFYVTAIHVAALTGFYRYLSGRQPSAWKMAQR